MVSFSWKELSRGLFSFHMIFTYLFFTCWSWWQERWNRVRDMSTWARDVDWAFIRRSESLLDVCWEFFVRSIYFLCPGNWEFTRHQNEGIDVVLVSLLLVLSKFGTFFWCFCCWLLMGYCLLEWCLLPLFQFP